MAIQTGNSGTSFGQPGAHVGTNQSTNHITGNNNAFNGSASQDYRNNYQQRNDQRTGGNATLAAVMGNLGLRTTGQSNPELLAAAQQINKWLEGVGNISATDPNTRVNALVLDGAQLRLPQGRSILVMAVLDLASGMASYSIINSLAILDILSTMPRNVQVPSNELGNYSTHRTIQRPETATELFMLSDVKLDNGEVTSAVRRVTMEVNSWLCGKYAVSNITVAQCGVLLVPMMTNPQNPATMSEADIQIIRDALYNQVATMRAAVSDQSSTLSLASLARSDARLSVSIQPGHSDVLLPNGVAIGNNIQLVITMGGNQQRYSQYAANDGHIEQTILGIIYAQATLIVNPDFQPNQNMHPDNNPLFTPVFTITGVNADVVSPHMATLLTAVSSYAISSEDVAAAALPTIQSASRDAGVLGLLPYFGSEGRRIEVGRDVNTDDFLRSVLMATSRKTQVRIEYDPSDLKMAAMFRQLWLATYGEAANRFRDDMYRQIAELFGVQNIAELELPEVPTRPSGLTYTGHFTAGGEVRSLSSMDLIGSLSALPSDVRRAYTQAEIQFGDGWPTVDATLAAQHQLLQATAPNAKYVSISFGMRISPQYLTALMSAANRAGLQVAVGGTRDGSGLARTYHLDTGFGGGRNMGRSGGYSFQ